MTRTRHALVLVTLFVAVALGSFALGRVRQVSDAAASPVTPFHEHLAADVGVWDTTRTVRLAPDVAAMVAQGVETNTLACGGLWLVSTYESSMAAAPYQEHGVIGYDPETKTYTSIRVDSLDPVMRVARGTCSEDGRTRTLSVEAPDPYGRMASFRHVATNVSGDKRTFVAYAVAPDGQEWPVVEIEYSRRKPR